MSLIIEKEIPVEQLLGEVSVIKGQGARFVTMTCTDLGESLDVIYHFDKNYELRNVRLTLVKGQLLPSISPLFFAAALIENEMQDMFGITVQGLVIDYKGKFLLAEGAPKAPLIKTRGIVIDARIKTPASTKGGENHDS